MLTAKMGVAQRGEVQSDLFKKAYFLHRTLNNNMVNFSRCINKVCPDVIYKDSSNIRDRKTALLAYGLYVLALYTL
jgi:hypothetical protein